MSFQDSPLGTQMSKMCGKQEMERIKGQNVLLFGCFLVHMNS